MDLTANGPVDLAAAANLLRNHALPGAERVADGGRRLERLLTVDGRLRHVALELTESGARVTSSTDAIDRVVVLVRAWLDLDSDVEAIGAALSADPRLAVSVAARPGLRAVRCPEAFEAAIAAVLGQQVSVAAARTFGGRAVAPSAAAAPKGSERSRRRRRCWTCPSRS
uniref:AlkA N-terminal domain-containing protein n=1 Tax=Rathayibacter sp. VKM Ac-2630 TaxID=1938617 RepID=UPI00191BF0E6|nr:AlkA N-terminal domain-containing protein [Rathayibacter sp. VKM Ac-2630]